MLARWYAADLTGRRGESGAFAVTGETNSACLCFACVLALSREGLVSHLCYCVL